MKVRELIELMDHNLIDDYKGTIKIEFIDNSNGAIEVISINSFRVKLYYDCEIMQIKILIKDVLGADLAILVKNEQEREK